MMELQIENKKSSFIAYVIPSQAGLYNQEFLSQ